MTTMAGLVSPKPVYHPQGGGQYSGYPRGLSAFSETPPLSTGSAGPQLGAFPNAGVSHALALQTDAKIYNLVVDLMDPATREAALLELSKKREQYDDLALVLWHSFGAPSTREIVFTWLISNLPSRHYANSFAGNRICLSSPFTTEPHCPCVQPRLQCPGFTSMCRISLGHSSAFPKWYDHFSVHVNSN